jgi:hypothetical protein
MTGSQPVPHEASAVRCIQREETNAMPRPSALRIVLPLFAKLALCAFALAGSATATSITIGVATASKAEAVPRRVRRACRRDYKRLCPRYRAGTARMRNCMYAHGSEISYRCYEALSDYGYINGHKRKRRRGRRSRRRRY